MGINFRDVTPFFITVHHRALTIISKRVGEEDEVEVMPGRLFTGSQWTVHAK